MIEMLYPYWKVPPMAAEHTVRASILAPPEGLPVSSRPVPPVEDITSVVCYFNLEREENFPCIVSKG